MCLSSTRLQSLWWGWVCVMAVGWRIIEEMVESNSRLESAQQTLRTLVDADSLTGLSNRRRMREFVSAMSQTDGTVVFIDVDHFKMINDGGVTPRVTNACAGLQTRCAALFVQRMVCSGSVEMSFWS